MKENKIMGILIPVVAILVIIESIVLVSSLERKSGIGIKTNSQPEIQGKLAVKANQNEPAVIDLIFGTANNVLSIGKKYPIELNLMSKTDQALDAAEVYIKYDPTAFTVSHLSYDGRLPLPAVSKISEKKSLVAVSFLISQKDGLRIKSGDLLSLIKFDIVPKKVGNFEFQISTGKENEESATMFIENATGKNLTFTSNKLDVQVLK